MANQIVFTRKGDEVKIRKVGTLAECMDYCKRMHKRIRYAFTIKNAPKHMTLKKGDTLHYYALNEWRVTVGR